MAHEMIKASIETFSGIVDDVEPDDFTPYHGRISVNHDTKETRLLLITDSGDRWLVKLEGLVPLMGHNKTQECCD